MPVILQLLVPTAVPDPPLELDQVIWAMALLSEAVPLISTFKLDVLYVVLLVGDSMVITGAVVSNISYSTVNVSVDILPAASSAVTVIVLDPSKRVIPAMFQLVVPVAVPEPPLLFDQLTC